MPRVLVSKPLHVQNSLRRRERRKGGPLRLIQGLLVGRWPGRRTGSNEVSRKYRIIMMIIPCHSTNAVSHLYSNAIITMIGILSQEPQSLWKALGPPAVCQRKACAIDVRHLGPWVKFCHKYNRDEAWLRVKEVCCVQVCQLFVGCSLLIVVAGRDFCFLLFAVSNSTGVLTWQAAERKDQ